MRGYDLTTVRQPMEEMIGCGIDLLLRRIAEPSKPLERCCFPNELVIRSSPDGSRFQPPHRGTPRAAATERLHRP